MITEAEQRYAGARSVFENELREALQKSDLQIDYIATSVYNYRHYLLDKAIVSAAINLIAARRDFMEQKKELDLLDKLIAKYPHVVEKVVP